MLLRSGPQLSSAGCNLINISSFTWRCFAFLSIACSNTQTTRWNPPQSILVHVSLLLLHAAHPTSLFCVLRGHEETAIVLLQNTSQNKPNKGKLWLWTLAHPQHLKAKFQPTCVCVCFHLCFLAADTAADSRLSYVRAPLMQKEWNNNSHARAQMHTLDRQ